MTMYTGACCGGPLDRQHLTHINSVFAIALLDDAHVPHSPAQAVDYVVGHYRYSLGKWTWSPPKRKKARRRARKNMELDCC